MRLWDWIYGCIPNKRHYRAGGVYALYQEGRLIYIGRSSYLRARIQAHRRRMAFDAVKIAPITNVFDQQLLERRLLYRLRPPMNRVLPSRMAGVWYVRRGERDASR